MCSTYPGTEIPNKGTPIHTQKKEGTPTPRGTPCTCTNKKEDCDFLERFPLRPHDKEKCVCEMHRRYTPEKEMKYQSIHPHVSLNRLLLPPLTSATHKYTYTHTRARALSLSLSLTHTHRPNKWSVPLSYPAFCCRIHPPLLSHTHLHSCPLASCSLCPSSFVFAAINADCVLKWRYAVDWGTCIHVFFQVFATMSADCVLKWRHTIERKTWHWKEGLPLK